MADAIGEARYGAEVRAEVCARLEAGESLNAICADPHMPTTTTIHHWAKRDEAFGEAKRRAQRAAWRGARKTEVELEAARKAVQAAMPPKRPGRPNGYSLETADEICRRIAHGEGIAAICRDEAMPCLVTVYAWMRRNPEFARMYATAREIQAHARYDMAWEIACAATPRNVEVARLQVGVIRWQASRLAPRKYGDWAGDEDAPVVVHIRKWGVNGWADEEAAAHEALGAGDWD